MDYKATLNLPKTAFPMKANPPESEPKMLAWWEQFGMYKRLRQVAADRPLWILHDGPPYANGNIHLGHVLNKVLKDVIVKSRAMLGFNAVYVPGWDCHGLPIEHQVDKELGLDDPAVDVRRAMDPVEKRKKCREYALRYIDIQRNEFKRLGVFGDWDNPYVTMAPAYQAIIAREFGRFVGRGLVHKGLKPVHWCMHCKTALAQAEVEYADQRTPSVWVKFPLNSVPAELQTKLAGRRAFAVIWTTTPWTLPANLAIAVHPTQSYVAVEAFGEVYIVARARVNDFLTVLGNPKHGVLGFFEGAQLVGHTFRHPWIDREGTIAAADFVAMDQGTGLVHIAPGHGEEDYELGRSLGLPIFNPVDDDGRFVPGVEHFAGLTVWEANPRIVDHLRSVGMLVAERRLDHTYPHCWRCKNPTLFRATEQWFIELDKQGFRASVLEAIKRDVQWIPPWGEERIYNMVAHRPEWVLSRQRVWGVPIVAFYCAGCGTLLLEERIIDHVARLFREGQGADEWYARAARALLPPGTRCAKCGGDRFAKETDILDVWFDSGCSHAAVLETRPELRWPAEMYIEGSDQHRGWFQSSLLESVGTRGAPPYKSVITHGFFVDGDGRKMSKSLGNVIGLDDLLPKYGAEILRLWVAAADDPRRRAAQTASYDIFGALARLMAPILTFTAEEAWRHTPGVKAESIHLERFPEVPREWLDDTLAREWGRLLEVRREVTKALETARAQGLIGSGLEARLRVAAAPEDLPELLRAKRALLPTLFIVSQVELGGARTSAAVQYESQEIPGLVIGVDKALGRKCQRCWTWSERVGEHRAHPGLCERCVPVVLARGSAS